MSVKEFYCLTLRQFELLSDGYRRKTEINRVTVIDSWRQTRLLAYILARDNMKDKTISMYDFYPLPDDPTAEQIKESIEIEKNKDSEWMKQVIENHRKLKHK